MPPGDVTVNIPGLHVLLRAPYGMIGRDLIRRANNVAALARQLCPVGESSGEAHIHLRDTIEADKRPFDIGTGLGLYVRAKKFTAMWVHEGRGEVTPKTKTILRFTVNGDVVFTKKSKPTKGNPFLRKALPAAGH